MEHHDDIGIVLQGVQVAGLLVAPVAGLVRVPDELERQLARQLDRLVGGEVVHQDHLVDLIERNRLEGVA